MKKTMLTTIITACAIILQAQTIPAATKAWIAKEKKLSNVQPKDFSTTTFADDLDFSNVFFNKNTNNLVGFIGANKQCLQLHITSITKDETKKDFYNVQGKSLVKGNLCGFEGFIVLSNIFKATPLNYAQGTPIAMGIVTAAYYFNEDPTQKNTGHFEGVLLAKWAINPANQLVYNDYENDFDGFYNNQYVGIWQSYATKAKKPCNWGDGCIPLCGDLNTNPYNFEPAKKYLKFGWQTFIDNLKNSANLKPWWDD